MKNEYNIALIVKQAVIKNFALEKGDRLIGKRPYEEKRSDPLIMAVGMMHAHGVSRETIMDLLNIESVGEFDNKLGVFQDSVADAQRLIQSGKSTKEIASEFCNDERKSLEDDFRTARFLFKLRMVHNFIKIKLYERLHI